MTEHCVKLSWKRETPDFDYKNYDRNHHIEFPGGQILKTSAAPAFQGDPALVNPEESFLASLSSCHMLTFLAIASLKKYVIDSYVDEPEGSLGKNVKGKTRVAKVTLRPLVVFSGYKLPTAEELAVLHDKAHDSCFIANSVSCDVEIVPR